MVWVQRDWWKYGQPEKGNGGRVAQQQGKNLVPSKMCVH